MTHRWDGVIYLLGSVPPARRRYVESPQGFNNYLLDCGVQYYTGEELTTPGQPAKATALLYKHLLPQRVWWNRGAALALLAAQLRRIANGPVASRNWWRPADYNNAVGGAAASDHLTATALDLYFKTVTAQRKALMWLEHLYTTAIFELSIGVGAKMLHVGLFSPGGQRRWTY